MKRSIVVGLVAFGLAACGTGAKEKAVNATLTTMSDTDRRQSFEATARVLDQHPDFVDTFYAVARQHPATFERFLADSARDMKDPDLARLTVALLAKHPDSVEQVMANGTAAFAKVPDDRAAVRRALADHAEEAVDMLTDDPEVLARLLTVSLDMLERKPQARRAVLQAMNKDRKRVIAFVKEDPELVAAIGKEMLREVVKDKPVLETTLRAAKVLP